MVIKAKQEIPLVLLAIEFTIGLVYTSVELPRIINSLLHNSFTFPHGDPVQQPELIKKFISSDYLTLIGYGSLIFLLLLVLAGFLAEKQGLATAGALNFFIPVFGHFCRSMFFLA